MKVKKMWLAELRLMLDVVKNETNEAKNGTEKGIEKNARMPQIFKIYTLH